VIDGCAYPTSVSAWWY